MASKISICVDMVSQASITLEGIDNVDDFVEKLDRIEPPSQLVSLLADPRLQKFVDLKPSSVATARIGIWLSTCLEEQYEAYRLGSGDGRYLSEVLHGLLMWAQYTKVSACVLSAHQMANCPSHYIQLYWHFYENFYQYGTDKKIWRPSWGYCLMLRSKHLKTSVPPTFALSNELSQLRVSQHTQSSSTFTQLYCSTRYRRHTRSLWTASIPLSKS